jgi:adenine-specific DNA-methyltransferase
MERHRFKCADLGLLESRKAVMEPLSTYSHSLEKRRRSGIYYTPANVAKEVTRWAITDRDAIVLDPSFGGCAFLNAAVQRLRSLEASSPVKQIYGADKDRNASVYIKPFLKEGAHVRQFKFQDFLTLRPFHFDSPFSTIVGNPPYIKHHTLSHSRIDIARRALGSDSVLSRKASYWAYFVLHAISFLRHGGRMGFILPGAFMHADYAKHVQRHIAQNFRKITAILVTDRIFSDAQESSVILLAEGKEQVNGEVRVLSSCLSDLQLDDQSFLDCKPLSRATVAASWTRAIVDKAVLRTYSILRKCSQPLGSLASIKIGTVTGANDFFILSPSVAGEKAISDRVLHPILTRAAQLKGLEISETEVDAIIQADASCLLVLPSTRGRMSKAIKRWIAQGKLRNIHHRYKCVIRDLWYKVPVQPAPDAFLSYMSGAFPRLMLNRTTTTCTNAIHQLVWKPKVCPQRVAIAFLSSVTQLSCEIEGRFYGGGVLKLEPSEAARVLVPILPIDSDEDRYQFLHHLCKDGDYERATHYVDDLLVKAGLVSIAAIAKIRAEIRTLRLRRLSQTPN